MRGVPLPRSDALGRSPPCPAGDDPAPVQPGAASDVPAHDISRLPDVEGDEPRRSRSRRHPVGFVHINIAEIRTEECKLHLFVAIDGTSEFALVKLVAKAGGMAAARFPRDVTAGVPCRIHTVLNDSGARFASKARDRSAFQHVFGRIRGGNDIGHRKTKVNHPWTNGQVERINRTIREAAVRRYHCVCHDRPRQHLTDFIATCGHARRLKTPRGLTPLEHIVKCWTEKPDRFSTDRAHHMPGPNT